jgi:iron complex transport system substrate-binding protein
MSMRMSCALTTVALAATAVLTACAAGSGGEGYGSGSGPSHGTHTLSTVMGEVKVPDDPKRVVVLNTAELDSAITLGVKPVGATSTGTGSGFLDYLGKDQTSGIKDVGRIGAPNLEAIAALEPDLILGSEIRDADHYAELSRIAPTVFTESTGAPWKADFLVHAAALGRSAAAKKAIAAYRAHTAQVTAALGGADAAARTKVSMVRFVEGADIRLYARENYIGTLLADVGLGRPAAIDQASDGFSLGVSPEQIDRADGDVLFYSTYGDAKAAKETVTTGGPLWKKLAPLKNHKAFRVDDELWYQGIGYTAADKILDELKAYLTT